MLAGLGLLLASLSGRRAYATGAVAIFFFLTWTLASLLTQIGLNGTSGALTSGQPSSLARLAA